MIKIFSPEISATESDWQAGPGAWECMITKAAQNWNHPMAVVVPKKDFDIVAGNLNFFAFNIEILEIPSLGTLPYDRQSPSVQVIAQRVHAFNCISSKKRQITVMDEDTFFSRLPPKDELLGHAFELKLDQTVDINELSLRLVGLSYEKRRQVTEVGEFAARGSILDVFPPGSAAPVRLDFFDKKIESIRKFDPASQRSIGILNNVLIESANEIRLSSENIRRFKKNFRLLFGDKWKDSLITEQIQQGIYPSGVECYLPLFFEKTNNITDYLPENTAYVFSRNLLEAEKEFFDFIEERYKFLTLLDERPLIEPNNLYISFEQIKSSDSTTSVKFLNSSRSYEYGASLGSDFVQTLPLPSNLELEKILSQIINPSLKKFRKILVVLPKEKLKLFQEMPGFFELDFAIVNGWSGFLKAPNPVCLTIGSISKGFYSIEDSLIVHVLASKKQSHDYKKTKNGVPRLTKSFDQIIESLTSWELDSPVVHRQYGVGRFKGLTILTTDNVDTEYLEISYADQDKLYVPIRSMNLVEKYTGASPENAPLHKLGSGQWEKVKRRAKRKANDAAVEILEILARRSTKKGRKYSVQEDAFSSFCQGFYFEETPDQQQAINEVLADLESSRPMDRLLCGDVGFGKTEVAMRAAFVISNFGDQVAILAPTTILVQQHFDAFVERFADTPIKISALSRSIEKKNVASTIAEIEKGSVDIVIGTHKLLSSSIRFKRLGLLIIDEEHRFGVLQKEKIKKYRGDVNVLSMTATPIPRTLNMSLSGMKDLSIMATPPENRVPINTMVLEWSDEIIKESITREISRGGQVYFIHNEVKTIEEVELKIKRILPKISLKIVHGQLNKISLGQIMREFYRGDIDLLLATTIVESGIDNPRTNTIIINKAHKLGLAQLYQLRGRVGRSNRSAFAYIFIPNRKLLSADSLKRVEAIESLNQLGMGFLLASHDLEIRGAGEVLGEDQSGEIHQMGYSMFNDLLAKTVETLSSADQLDKSVDTKEIEMNLNITALLPEKYLPDIHERLSIYKRLAAAKDVHELDSIEEEMIDRFGEYPEVAKNLVDLTRIKIKLIELGVSKVEFNKTNNWVEFNENSCASFENMMELITSNTDYSFRNSQSLRIKKILASPKQKLDELKFLYEKLRKTSNGS